MADTVAPSLPPPPPPPPPPSTRISNRPHDFVNIPEDEENNTMSSPPPPSPGAGLNRSHQFSEDRVNKRSSDLDDLTDLPGTVPSGNSSNRDINSTNYEEDNDTTNIADMLTSSSDKPDEEGEDEEEGGNTRKWKSAWKVLTKEFAKTKTKIEVIEEFQDAAAKAKAKAKKNSQLRSVALELLETEETYHSKLHSLVNNWQGPLIRWSKEQKSFLEAEAIAEQAALDAKQLSSSAKKKRRSSVAKDDVEAAAAVVLAAGQATESGNDTGSTSSLTAQQPPITEAEVRVLFGNAEELLSISESLMFSLEDALESTKEKEQGIDQEVMVLIGECFSKLESSLHSYGTYLATAETATTLLDNLNKRVVVQIFMDCCRHQIANLKGASLSSLLIEPVQRLPRYSLLLRELIKFSEDGEGKQALKTGMKSVEKVCSAINQEMADADMYQRLSKLSKMWGVDVLSRTLPASVNSKLGKNPALNQVLLYGGILRTQAKDALNEADMIPVLFVTKNTQKKAEPTMFKAMLTRDLFVIGHLETSKMAKKAAKAKEKSSSGISAAHKAAAAAAQAAVHNSLDMGTTSGSSGDLLGEDGEGGGGLMNGEEGIINGGTRSFEMGSLMRMEDLTDPSLTVSGMKSTSSSSSLLNNKVQASAMVKLSSKCLLVKGFDVIASFKPTKELQNGQGNGVFEHVHDESTKYTEEGVAIYNMLKLDKECSHIVNTCGVRQQDLNRTNSNPSACFLLLTEGLTFAMFAPSDQKYSDSGLGKWYDMMAKAVGDHQLGKI